MLQREQFYTELSVYLDTHNIDSIVESNAILSVGSFTIDLYYLFLLVYSRGGGYKKIEDINGWMIITKWLYHGSEHSIKLDEYEGFDVFIRTIYTKYLLGLENCYNNSQPNSINASNNKVTALKRDYNWIEPIRSMKKNTQKSFINGCVIDRPKQLFNKLNDLLKQLQLSKNTDLLDDLTTLCGFPEFCELFFKYPAFINELMLPLGIFKRFRQDRSKFWNTFLTNIRHLWCTDVNLFSAIFYADFIHYYKPSLFNNCNHTSFNLEYLYMAKLSKIFCQVLENSNIQIPIINETDIIKFSLICIYMHPISNNNNGNNGNNDKNNDNYNSLTVANDNEQIKTLSQYINSNGWSMLCRISKIWIDTPIDNQLYLIIIDCMNKYLYAYSSTAETMYVDEKDMFINIFSIVENICYSIQLKFDKKSNITSKNRDNIIELDELNFVWFLMYFLTKLTPLLPLFLDDKQYLNNDILQVFLNCLYTLYKISYILPTSCYMLAQSDDFIRLLSLFLNNQNQKIDKNPTVGDSNEQIVELYCEVVSQLNRSLYELLNTTINHDTTLHATKISSVSVTSNKSVVSLSLYQLLNEMFNLKESDSEQPLLTDYFFRAKVKILLSIVLCQPPTLPDDLSQKLLFYLENDFSQFCILCKNINLKCTPKSKLLQKIYTFQEDPKKMNGLVDKILFNISLDVAMPTSIHKNASENVNTSENANTCENANSKPLHLNNNNNQTNSRNRNFLMNMNICPQVRSSIVETILRIFKNICSYSTYGRMIIQIKFWDKIVLHAFPQQSFNQQCYNKNYNGATIAVDIMNIFYYNDQRQLSSKAYKKNIDVQNDDAKNNDAKKIDANKD